MTMPRPDQEMADLQDYSLVGSNTQQAIDAGLAEAEWYTSPVSKQDMRDLMTRRDWPALRDSIIYFGLILGFGYLTYYLWGSLWALIPMMAYGILWASASDARWHESGHGTAFKTDWLNNCLYEVASFMVLRESVPWRWSHTRHHSDTIIVGRDPEIAVPRPPDLKTMLLKMINFQAFRRYLKNITLHSLGKITPEEATFIPESEYPKVFLRARIYAAIYLVIFGLAIYYQTWLPFIFVLGPNLYGAWLMPIYGWTQHAGLAENVLDHRLNCRTVEMNIVHRFLYLNMNYHLEHHMFPLVPYYHLPRLHQIVKDDCPKPYRGLIETYREIIPTVFRQMRDPGFYIKRKLPDTARPIGADITQKSKTTAEPPTTDGWVEVCSSDTLELNDVIRFDYADKTYAVYRTADGELYASDGICTHGSTHLADGLVKGKVVECPKHNGRFDVTDGSPVRPPVCVALQTYPVEERQGQIYLCTETRQTQEAQQYRVVSNHNVATFIKELVLAPMSEDALPDYLPGQYMQLDIPAFSEISLREIDADAPYDSVWADQHIGDYRTHNDFKLRRNYSIATAPEVEKDHLKFNVRIATPPRGQDCDAGIGSTYVHNLKPGDTVSAVGPFGDFLIKETDREMVYLGGGAGMAPLRSHLVHLLKTLDSGRKISFWYGARSLQEVFYAEEFRDLEERYKNFTFHLALSEPQPEDGWTGPTGFIHDHLRQSYLNGHSDPTSIEYYLCGPPMMLEAARTMLISDFSITEADIAFDAF